MRQDSWGRLHFFEPDAWSKVRFIDLALTFLILITSSKGAKLNLHARMQAWLC